MKAPFPYMGGKSSIAHIVWDALGDVAHYIEPCFGSGAVLLNRPAWHKRRMETVNDKDGHIANVWRSLQYNPDEVAKWCDWPVNHADLMARKSELIDEQDELLSKLVNDTMYCNPKLAGYWIWCDSCWIGAGMLCPTQRPNVGDNKGINSRIPRLSKGFQGIQNKTFYNAELGIDNPHVPDPYKPGLYVWFRELSERLRKVRVVCGDWSRVCGGDWQDNSGTCGIFFDPPYSDKANRSKNIYAEDSLTVAHDIAKWALERGKKSSYLIVLAGYYEEHDWLLDEGWSMVRWQARGGYANKGSGQGKVNKTREALFLSPHCIQSQKELF